MKTQDRCGVVLCGAGTVFALCLSTIFWAGWGWSMEQIPEFRTRSEEGCHTSGIYLATRRIQNKSVTAGYSVDVCSGETTVFHAPRVILKPGFRAQRGSIFRAGTPVFDVHVAVLHPDAGPLDTRAEFLSVLDTLNARFESDDGEQLVRFRLKSFTTWQEIDDAHLDPTDSAEDPCVEHVASSGDSFDSATLSGFFGQGAGSSCSTSGTVIRDMDALNMFIYDVTDNECHGQRNGGYPWIIIDIDRINDTDVNHRQNPEAHEMGHAFGLGHVCDDQVDSMDDDSNTMASGRGCPTACNSGFSAPFSGGNRLLGFAHAPYVECSRTSCSGATICQEYQNAGQPRIGQVSLVLWYAEEFAKNFGYPHSWSASLPIRLPCSTGTCDHYP